MDEYNKLLEEIEIQEKTLAFPRFTNNAALEIGLILVESGRKLDRGITIDINRNGQQLFHYSFDGTSPDNDEWVARKNRVVNRFHHSSLYIGTLLKNEQKSIEQRFHISSFDYCPYGGAFPIIIEGVGVVGTITVSGLTEEEDHGTVVAAIKQYLSKNN